MTTQVIAKSRVNSSATWGKLFRILGIISLVFWIIILTGSINYSDSLSQDTISCCKFFIILNVILITIGYLIKFRVKRYNVYMPLIFNEGMSSISDIAIRTNHSTKFVQNDIKRMIQKNYFTTIMLDSEANKIVLLTFNSNSKPSGNQTPKGPESLQCKSCGAMNSNEDGKTTVCEYCGSPLE